MTRVTLVLALLLLGPISLPSSFAADEPDELMPGRSLLIREDRLVRFVATPAAGPFDLPDAGNAPTGVGAFLWLMDLGTAFEQTYFSLPAANWTRVGNGYRYVGSRTPSDPCRVVVVRGTAVKALCRSTSLISSSLSPFRRAARRCIASSSRRPAAINAVSVIALRVRRSRPGRVQISPHA